MHLETEYFVSELSDDIIFVQYKPNIHIRLEDAQRIVSERQKFYGNIQVPVLIKNARIKGIDKPAREYLFSKERGLKDIKAIAIVCSNVVSKLLITFIFHHHRPAIPHKMFTEEAKAISWLKQYV
ncbi:SpoIIAA-like [Catalinimonas alkaloidigena]|uniref:SpoIIAA-like n=1 Tax=Catalinimonas alkaloidigena TaxID=1075417 RepID=A0A1G9N466_9BACT|nr:STAS/SEC14 domain-containing protein [Catalinimonas alkaloidigena]SDL81312.1 SpoIIAA-like [Catalinimonas alkaloidigena]